MCTPAMPVLAASGRHPLSVKLAVQLAADISEVLFLDFHCDWDRDWDWDCCRDCSLAAMYSLCFNPITLTSSSSYPSHPALPGCRRRW
jgi:hypothetical protein